MNNVVKFIIFIPLVILVLALYIHLAGLQGPSTTVSLKEKVQKSIQSKAPSTGQMQNPSGKSGESKLDLKGPYVCVYKEDGTNVKIFIENRSIFGEVNTDISNFLTLVSGDCMYKWQKDTKSGTKVCGISQYYSIIDALTSLPFFSIDTLVGMLFKMDPNMRIDEATLNKLIASCKKTPVDRNFMIPPKAIEFVEEKIQKPSGLPKE